MSLVRFRSIAIDDPTVERDSNGLPTAFRIWKPGANPTVQGIDILDSQSILLLKKQVAEHVSLFPFDANHLSVKRSKDEEVTPKNQEAIGWHTLGFRPSPEGEEVWAENCEWRAPTRAALLDEPPGWRFFSPALRADLTGRIVGYINCALTNTPAGFSLPSLRSISGGTLKMDLEQLADLLGLEGDAKDAFIAANKDKTQAELAAALMAAPKLESTAAIAEGDVKQNSEGAPGGDGGKEPKPELRSSLGGLTVDQLRSIVRSEVRASTPAAPRKTEPAAPPPTSAQSNAIVEKFRNAMGLPNTPPVAPPTETWLTNAGGTFRIRHATDRIRATQIGAQFAAGIPLAKGGV